MENIDVVKKFDSIMISIMSSDTGALSYILSKVREIGYNGLVFVGGPASFEYNKLLRKYDRIDYIVVGEAELSLKHIVDKHDLLMSREYSLLEKIPALAYRRGDEVVLTTRHIYTPPNVFSKIIPWTRIDVSYKSYKSMRYYVEVVRGCSNYYRPLLQGYGLNCIRCDICRKGGFREKLYCPANIPPGCGFCSVPYMFGPARTRLLESILEEIKKLVENGAKRIVLSAPDFLDYGRDWLVKPEPLTDPCRPEPNIDAIKQLLEEIQEIPGVRERNVVVMIENIKACLVNDEVARVLGKYLRGTTIHIGLETGDSVFNEEYLGKPIGVEHVFKAVKLLRKHGLRPYVYLLYGLPFMEREVYLKTINVVRRLYRMGVEKITLYKYVDLPGTAFQYIKYDVKGREALVKKLKSIVRRINRDNKKKYLGRNLEVMLTYSNGKYYGYPLYHGPVVYVKELENPRFDGCRALVHIYDYSDRNLWGRFIKMIDC